MGASAFSKPIARMLGQDVGTGITYEGDPDA